MKLKKLFIHGQSLLMAVVLFSCSDVNQSAQQYIDGYTEELLSLYYASAEASWKTNTQIIEGDTLNAYESKQADEALAAFMGSTKNIEKTRKFLESSDQLTDLQIRQLEAILYSAGSNPQIVEELVRKKIQADIAQTETLYGFTYTLDGKKVSTNEIDNILFYDKDPDKRLAAWESSKEVGPELKDGLENLRNLRNQTVQALGYNDYFTYQVSEYGLTTEEMMYMMDKLYEELLPLYRELHTYARYELAKQYNSPEVPDYLPAHWAPNRWGQDWGTMIKVEGLDIDSALADKSPEWIVKEGEKLYVSLGFPELPATFWEKSSLYPYPSDSVVKKNNHASAWHMDLKDDVRSLMSVQPNEKWFQTSNHELGHIYYYISYTNPDVPPLLRGGANRAFHEAIGSMMGAAALQKPYLVGRGLIDENSKSDNIQKLLAEAMDYAVFIPFAAGTMSNFEKALYVDDLPKDQFNAKWWEIVKKYQGIVPPNERGEEFCDACTKTHINDDPAQYYDYALSYIILFQLHQHIAENILKQDPRETNYYGATEVGDFLKEIMRPGATKDWQDVLKGATGETLNATAMVKYFEPLVEWLKEQNKGRKYTL
ncbi:MAG: M2 family metallopeptidase [Cyclobacteriaceae bacterium]|nr:M2 family metallopeptidase [Cyclobacteriaceae bacterium SS2]